MQHRGGKVNAWREWCHLILGGGGGGVVTGPEGRGQGGIRHDATYKREAVRVWV